MRWVKCRKGAKDEYLTLNDQDRLSVESVVALLGAPIHVVILKSDDYLIVREDWKDYEEHGPNHLASILLKEPVYGDCLILEPKEFDYEDWLRQSRDIAIAECCGD